MPSGEAREVPEAGADQRAGVVHPVDAELAPLVLDDGVAVRRAEGDREAAPGEVRGAFPGRVAGDIRVSLFENHGPFAFLCGNV